MPRARGARRRSPGAARCGFPCPGRGVSRCAFEKRPVQTWPPAPRMTFGRPPMRVASTFIPGLGVGAGDCGARGCSPSPRIASPATAAAASSAAAAATSRAREGRRGAFGGGAGGASAVPAVRVSISIGAAAPVATIVSRPAARPPAAAAIAARPRSPADWKRCSGALASARAITSSNAVGDPGRRLADGGGRLGEVRPQLRLVALGRERRPAREHVVQDAAERVDVRARVHALAADLLGRDEVDRPHPVAGLRRPRVREHVLGEPEVGQVGVLALPEQDVRRLDVAMYEP